MVDYLLIAVSLGTIAVLIWRARRVQRLEVGALYSVRSGAGDFAVVKVVAFDAVGVHVRLYKNRFRVRPRSADVTQLTLGSIDEPGLPGVGHMAVVKKTFYRWYPLIIGYSDVTAEELEGYELWKDGQGGYFTMWFGE